MCLFPVTLYEYIGVTRYINIYRCASFLWLFTRVSAHGGDQTQNIWISRSISFPDRSLEWRGLRLLTWKLVWNFRDSHENLLNTYVDFIENLMDMLPVVIIWSPISSVRWLFAGNPCLRGGISFSVKRKEEKKEEKNKVIIHATKVN